MTNIKDYDIITTQGDDAMRTVALKALVGSHNYNLHTDEMIYKGIVLPASDKDYKVFVLPTFEDLYKQKMFADQIIGVSEDNDIHDIRKLVDLFYKSNINFIEVVYSTELVIPNKLPEKQRKLLVELLSYKNEIVKMNLPHLFNACGGMHHNKMKLLEKGTEGTQHLVEAFGYDTKQALHAYRVLDFIIRFADTDFKDFKQAMTYTGKERDFMLEIKHGFFDIDSYRNFVSFYYESKYKTLRDKYSANPNEELKEHIGNIVMELVKLEIVA